jgi:pimeloyl-ACP methyl ester carboxylesterase
VVLPGLAAGDGSTDPLRRFLRVLGYDVLGWGLGRNVGPTVDIRRGLADLVAAAYRRRQQPVSLVGWSMGGIYARELARQAPDAVREVVTLGSPFRDRERAAALPVPATSLYSRSDGIVPWERCLDLVSERAENIEVVASHIGLGHNPAVLHVVADRLAQPAGTWTPFTPRGAWVPFFPRRRAA